MSLGLWPDAVPFDPESGTASHDLRARLDLDAAPAAILLVSGGSQQRTSWAARTAAAIAAALADAGRRVLLADLDFEAPTLHATFGEANVEGIADVLLFGASLERVVTRPAGQSFDLVAPGAFAPDPVAIMLDDGWPRVLADLAASGGTFIGYLPAAAPGVEIIAGRIADVIVLADEGEVAAAVARLPETIVLRALVCPAPLSPADELAPPAGEIVATSATDEEPPFESTPIVVNISDEAQAAAPAAVPADANVGVADATLRAMIDDLRERQRVASSRSGRAARDGTPVQTTLETLPAPDATPASRRATRKPPSRWPLGVLTMAMIAVLIGGVMFGRRYLASRAARTAQATDDQSNVTGVAEPRGRPLTYSVAIESFDAMDRAARRADSLAAAHAGVTFYVAPFRLDNATYYRVLAGPLADSASAATLMQTLVARGAKTAESPGDVRETPLAFLIGAYDVRVDADARRNQLRESGVPSYVVEVPYTSGPVRYHLYAGAYSVPSEAEAMRAMLRSAGVPDTLVVRIGQVGT
jgi:hypothetical protein